MNADSNSYVFQDFVTDQSDSVNDDVDFLIDGIDCEIDEMGFAIYELTMDLAIYEANYEMFQTDELDFLTGEQDYGNDETTCFYFDAENYDEMTEIDDDRHANHFAIVMEIDDDVVIEISICKKRLNRKE